MLTVNELFSGIGTQAYALEYLGVPHKIVGTAEILSSAIKAYNSGHGETMNYGDISKISSLNYADLWTYSFPCFTGDTLILTSNGLKRIDEVQVGMQVYSHRGELRDVLNVFDNGKHLIADMYIDGIDVIHTTSNHKFLVLQRGLLEWVSCDEIEIGSFLCVLRKGTDAYGIKDTNSKGLPTFNSTAVKNFKDLFVFKRVNKIDFTDRVEQVYDIEVDVDHSFIANGVVAHNCQDLSSGGKGKGIAAVDENGEPVATRSGLLWQVERLLAESRGYEIKEGLLIRKPNWDESLDTAPKYLLLENVPELITRKKHKIHFDKWLQRLEELGYNSFYGVLNGADFGDKKTWIDISISTGIGFFVGLFGGRGATNASYLNGAAKTAEFIKAATSYDKVLTKIATGAYKNLAGAAGAKFLTRKALTIAWNKMIVSQAGKSLMISLLKVGIATYAFNIGKSFIYNAIGW